MSNAAIKISFENFIAFGLINFVSEKISRMKNATADYKIQNTIYIRCIKFKEIIYASTTSVLLK
jgi:hypothetical protein